MYQHGEGIVSGNQTEAIDRSRVPRESLHKSLQAPEYRYLPCFAGPGVFVPSREAGFVSAGEKKGKRSRHRLQQTAGRLAGYLWLRMRWLAGGVLDLLAPSRCLCCDELLPGARVSAGIAGVFPICESCRPGLVLMGPACPRCGELVAAAEVLGSDSYRADPGVLCGACESVLPHQDSVSSSLVYEGAGKEILLAWKNSGEQALLVFLVELMFRHGGCPAGLSAGAGRPLVCPVPRHRLDRLLRRGMEGAHLAEAFASRRRWRFRRLLRKTRRTPRQAALGRKARLVNLRGAFCIRRGIKIPSHVVIVDDVLTTGSTVGECARVLKKAGAERVDVITVARSL